MKDGILRGKPSAGGTLPFNDCSKATQGALNTLVGQRIGSFIARVAVVPPDPTPIDGVTAADQQRIQPLPQINIFDRRLGGRAPAPGLPPVYPLGDTFEYVLAVEVKSDVAGPSKRGQRLNHCGHFHAVVGGTQLATK